MTGARFFLFYYLNGFLLFSQCYRGTDKRDEENSIPKSTKDANQFRVPTIQKKDMYYLLFDLK